MILGLLLVGVPSASWGAGTADPNGCKAPKVPVASATLTCPDDESPTASPSANAPSAPTSPGQQTQAAPSEGVKFADQDEPTGWAGPIAKDLGQSVQDLSGNLAKWIKDKGLLPKVEFSRAYLSLYAVMYGLGVVIAALAAMVASVKIADAKGVDARILAQRALLRLLAFTPVGALTPVALYLVGNLTTALAGGFFDLAVDKMVSELTWISGALGVGTLVGLIIPGGSAAMVGIFLALAVAIAGVWLELMLSHYLVFLLGLLVPILFGASINPEWQGGVKKVTGALLGAFLAPSALFLVWVVAFAAVPPPSSDNSFMTRAGVLVVGLLLGLAAPVAIGMLLSYIVPAFAGGNSSYQSGMLNGALQRVSPRSGSRPTGPRASRGKRASEVDDAAPSPAVESPTKTPVGGGAASSAGSAGAGGGAAGSAGSAGAASAAGPVGAAVGMWTRMVDKARNRAEATRDAVGASASRAEAADRGDSPSDRTGEPGARSIPDGGRNLGQDNPGTGAHRPRTHTTQPRTERPGSDEPLVGTSSQRAEPDPTEGLK